MAEVKLDNQKFYIGDPNQPDAELTFKEKDAETIIADHTFVDEKLRGQGVADQLFQELIQYARNKNLKIIPECSYIKMKMERTSEYDDVLSK